MAPQPMKHTGPATTLSVQRTSWDAENDAPLTITGGHAGDMYRGCDEDD